MRRALGHKLDEHDRQARGLPRAGGVDVVPEENLVNHEAERLDGMVDLGRSALGDRPGVDHQPVP